MWKSITARSSLTKNLGKKLFLSQNPASCSSQFQVLHRKGFNSSSNCSDLLIRVKPRNFFHQKFRFLSHSSSISEFESENHEPASSLSDGEVESDESVKSLKFGEDFDRNEEINGAQMNGFDETVENVEENVGSIDSLGSAEVLGDAVGGDFGEDFDRNEEINDTQMKGFDETVENVEENVGSIDSLGSAEVLGDAVDGDAEDAEDNVDSIIENSEEVDGSEAADAEKFENLMSLLQDSVDESLESSLNDLKLSLNEEIMLRVTEAAFVPVENLIRFFKWASSKKQFEITNATVLNSLVRAICVTPKKKVVYTLWDLVQKVGGDCGAVDVELLNQLISVFSEMGKGKAAFEVFGKFEELGCVPNSDTYYLTIEALCKRKFYEWAASVSQKMLDAGILPDNEKVGNIIYFYCKGGQSVEAHAVYLAAEQKNMYPPQRVVNLLISCLSKVDKTVPLAKEILADIPRETRKHAINPFSWVVRGLCRVNDLEGGKKLLLEMIEKGPPPGNAVFNTVINALSKAGELDDAREMLKLMESRGLKPDVFSYSVIISGYAKGGSMEEACKVLSAARKEHPKLCPATFHSIIRGYCKLEQFDKAVKLLSDMKKYGVEPNVDEYNKLIQSLCLKALDWETSEKLLEEMKSKGMHLPGITRGLISAVKELQQETSAELQQETSAELQQEESASEDAVATNA